MTIWMLSGGNYRTQINGARQITREDDEFPMTKGERMKNDQSTKHDDFGFSSLGLWASFVVRRSSFVISCCAS
ncbi:MAG: hypothetical protein AUI00_02145 [Verrucomicrobia bacterium 13_2_20CM_2_54_15]|nr:MAG: hypothetical protein AUI00_02145 [Verrucomicrobia bacterium 13_2_20CM_2_54_15]